MNFREWLYQESTFGSSFRYKFPEDKKHQIYDFYMLNQISNTNSLNRVRASSGMRGLDWQKGDERFQSREDQMDYAIEEAKKTLIDGLYKQLLQEVSYAIKRELRHWFDFTNFASYMSHGDREEKDDCDVPYASKLMKVKEPSDQCVADLAQMSNLNKDDVRALLKLYYRQETFVSRPMRRVELITPEQAQLAKRAFANTDWHDEYGGDAWANIVDGWMILNNAKTYPEKTTAIDHIYDLEHNTGSVLDKHPAYKSMKNVFMWHQEYGGHYPNTLKRVLDHKASITSPYEMIEYVSPAMKKLALAALRQKTGGSLEDYYANKDELEFRTFHAIKSKADERRSQQRRQQMRDMANQQLRRHQKNFERYGDESLYFPDY
jgi:hypothetical protein